MIVYGLDETKILYDKLQTAKLIIEHLLAEYSSHSYPDELRPSVDFYIEQYTKFLSELPE